MILFELLRNCADFSNLPPVNLIIVHSCNLGIRLKWLTHIVQWSDPPLLQCPSCAPQDCPLYSVCPLGTVHPTSCPQPWYNVNKQNQSCEMSEEFLAVIMVASAGRMWMLDSDTHANSQPYLHMAYFITHSSWHHTFAVNPTESLNKWIMHTGIISLGQENLPCYLVPDWIFKTTYSLLDFGPKMITRSSTISTQQAFNRSID